MSNIPFFVYGTLRPGEGNYTWCLEGKTTTEDTATLTGAVMYDYNGGSFPFVTLSPDLDDVVTGTLISVSEENYANVQISLDRLEGYNPAAPEQGMYRRELTNVTTEDGRTIQAYVYVCGHRMLDQVTQYPRITSGDWFHRDSPLADRFTR
ncbi:MAG: gamma-glutamylcyclotransferase family protein [Propionicimonas sp.]